MKEDAGMKRNIIALALIIVMLFSLSACGKKDEAAAPTQVPQQTQPAVNPDASATEAPQDNKGIEPNSGVYTYTSEVNGLSFDYDSKYIAMTNPAGNAMVYAGEGTDLPFCTISLIPMREASEYLSDMAAAAETELGKNLKTKAGEPQKVSYGDRDIFYIYYTYKDKDAGGVVSCAYYAENLDDGSIVVYNSTALEGQTEAVDSILKLALETFHIAGSDGGNV